LGRVTGGAIPLSLENEPLVSYQPAANRYQAMVYRRCGRSGLQLPAISLGLWNSFGEGASLESVRGVLFRAFDLGITHFDLANNYGPPPGVAEEILRIAGRC
jgi:L-glyceraldehyde 3-phosphate reductase